VTTGYSLGATSCRRLVRGKRMTMNTRRPIVAYIQSPRAPPGWARSPKAALDIRSVVSMFACLLVVAATKASTNGLQNGRRWFRACRSVSLSRVLLRSQCRHVLLDAGVVRVRGGQNGRQQHWFRRRHRSVYCIGWSPLESLPFWIFAVSVSIETTSVRCVLQHVLLYRGTGFVIHVNPLPLDLGSFHPYLEFGEIGHR
jgi:hypothetical protein